MKIKGYDGNNKETYRLQICVSDVVIATRSSASYILSLECLKTIIDVCFGTIILLFGSKMFGGLIHGGKVYITSKAKDPLTSMVTVFMSGYIVFICTAAIFIAGILSTLFFESEIIDGVEFFLGNDALWMSLLVFIVCATSVLCIEHHVLVIAAGYICSNAFGLGRGIFTVTVSSVAGHWIGSIISYAIGNFIYKRKGRTQEVRFHKEDVFHTLLLCRLAGNVSNWELNYCAGVLCLDKAEFGLSLLGYIPKAILFAQLGASLNSLGYGIFTLPPVIFLCLYVAFCAVCSYLSTKKLIQVLENLNK